MSDVITELAMEANDKAMQIARLNAENDRLREQSERLFDKTLELATENSKLRELCKLCEREAENAKLRKDAAETALMLGAAWEHCSKLRELVRDYERCTMHADCSRCEHDGKLSMHCPLSPCFPDSDELRELGVEVDG